MNLSIFNCNFVKHYVKQLNYQNLLHIEYTSQIIHWQFMEHTLKWIIFE